MALEHWMFVYLLSTNTFRTLHPNIMYRTPAHNGESSVTSDNVLMYSNRRQSKGTTQTCSSKVNKRTYSVEVQCVLRTVLTTVLSPTNTSALPGLMKHNLSFLPMRIEDRILASNLRIFICDSHLYREPLHYQCRLFLRPHWKLSAVISQQSLLQNTRYLATV